MKVFLNSLLLGIIFCLIIFSYLYIDMGYEKETKIMYIDIHYPTLYFFVLFSFTVVYLIIVDFKEHFTKEKKDQQYFKDVE
jgi:TRAP-type C4-dicarboxylate transport system permease small subunit